MLMLLTRFFPNSKGAVSAIIFLDFDAKLAKN